MTEENQQKRSIKILVGVLALFKLGLALFAWWSKDPDVPVTWGELRWIFLLEFVVLAYILYRIHLANYALYG